MIRCGTGNNIYIEKEKTVKRLPFPHGNEKKQKIYRAGNKLQNHIHTHYMCIYDAYIYTHNDIHIYTVFIYIYLHLTHTHTHTHTAL